MSKQQVKEQLYFSSILKEDMYYRHEFEQIIKALDKYNIQPKFLDQTKDIWCRDYMPIQRPDGSLVQFRYDPYYLKKKSKYRSVPTEVLNANRLEAETCDINLDGGNVVYLNDKAIVSERIFDENSDWIGGHSVLVQELERRLSRKLVLIPAHSKDDDMTGHSDGYVRFINDTTVLVSSLELAVKERLVEYGFKCIEMPCFLTSAKASAIGIYVNYLELNEVILFPVFKDYDSANLKALEVVANNFDKPIEPIEMYRIAQYGGLMNCISWSYMK